MSDIQRWDVDGRAVPNDTEGEYIKYDDINKIQAEGIRQMVASEFCRNKAPMQMDEILEYADKLEKGE